MCKRIQRQRTKGFRLADQCQNPLGYVVISRPGPLGNPFDWRDFKRSEWFSQSLAKWLAAVNFRSWLLSDEAAAYRTELEKHRGRDVVCWCGLDEACHGDAILEYWRDTE